MALALAELVVFFALAAAPFAADITLFVAPEIAFPVFELDVDVTFFVRFAVLLLTFTAVVLFAFFVAVVLLFWLFDAVLVFCFTELAVFCAVFTGFFAVELAAVDIFSL